MTSKVQGLAALPGIWDLGPAGIATLAGHIHHGTCFDVFLLAGDRRLFALKVPATDPATRNTAFLASRTLGGVSTTWSVSCEGGRPAHVMSPPDSSGQWWPAPSPARWLDAEADHLQSTGRRWNHSLVWRVDVEESEGTTIPALVTDWQHGLPLRSLARAEQRVLLPRVLLGLWDALCGLLHGDLNDGNIIVTPDRQGATLIDPGAQLAIRRGRHGPSCGADALLITTTPQTYPILPPHYVSSPEHAGEGIEPHWNCFLRSLTLSDQSPPSPAGTTVLSQVVRRAQGRFLQQIAPPASAPHVADQMALGILYYRALTGLDPFPWALPDPAWSRVFSVDDRIRGAEGVRERLTDVVPPRMVNATLHPAEDALVTALLTLRIRSRSQLITLIAACRTVGTQ